jgi:Spy/CpxP family protein refolding chaperone
MDRTIRFARTAGLLALTVALTTPVFAMSQETPPADAPARPTGDAPPTRGPRVPGDAKKADGERKAPKREGAEGGGRREGGAANTPFFRALREVKLTDEQKAKIEPIMEKARADQKAFQEANGPKIRELEQKRKDEVANGGRPSEETRKALEEIMSKRPKFDEAQKQVTALLTPEQQAEVKATMEKMNQRREGRGGERPGVGGRPGEGGRPARDGAGTGDGSSGRPARGGNGTGNGTTPPSRDTGGTGNGTTPPSRGS